MKRKKDSKLNRIQKAVDGLNKAMKLEDPHLQIHLPYGFDPETPDGKEFMMAMKNFIQAYKKFYGLKKMDVELLI